MNRESWTEVATLCAAVQEVTIESIELAFVDPGSTGDETDGDAASSGIPLDVVKLSEVRAAAQAWGGGAFVGVDGPLPPADSRLRAAEYDPGRDGLYRLRHAHAEAGRPALCLDFITRIIGRIFPRSRGRICHASGESEPIEWTGHAGHRREPGDYLAGDRGNQHHRCGRVVEWSSVLLGVVLIAESPAYLWTFLIDLGRWPLA